MNQEREHVVLCPEVPHVVLEAPRVDPGASASEHLHDVRAEPVEVHVNIDFQGIVGFSSSPVIGQNMAFHCRNYRPGIIDMPELPESVSVIPIAGLCKIHIVFLT